MRTRFTTGHFFLIMSVVSVIFTGVIGWFGYEYFRSEFPEVGNLKTQYPAVKYQGKDKPPLITLQKGKPSTWVDLGQIAKPAAGAVIVSEDWAFYAHEGYDAAMIKEAIKRDIETRKFQRGASTITQQVVKNVFLTRDKNLWRKFKELILAVRLEDQVTKKKILETYLNIAEWGEGVFGIYQAARHYFSKHPSELTAKEGAFLAMLLPSPKRYSQSYRQKNLTPYARKTIRSILRKMAQAHYLTPEERDAQIATPLAFERDPVREAPEPPGTAETPLDSPIESPDENSAEGADPAEGPVGGLGRAGEKDSEIAPDTRMPEDPLTESEEI